jgi:Chaperone of endosialidase
MSQPINLETTALALRNWIRTATARRGFLFMAFALAWFTLSPAPKAFGVTPAPDGGYPNNNTAEGDNALLNLTSGTDNTANGFEALFNNTTGYFNTANGSEALASNTEGGANTANGAFALSSNTTGGHNAATGFDALQKNTTGNGNTADGTFALSSNTTGGDNTAIGDIALTSNTTGLWNTATGFGALASNTNGRLNTATGYLALDNNVTGGGNTAIGDSALAGNITGSNNIALGSNAGINLTTGNNNIDIGARGVAGESNTIRIGTVGVQTSAYIRGISGVTVASGATVIVDAHGHLGTVQSSARFKDEIKPMDKASEAILALKPVTFRYKKELDPEGIPQFGLVAEQVEKVDSDLVARDENGQLYSVRYEAVNAMLLNEFLKEHRKVEEQDRKIRAQEATITQLRNEMVTVVAHLKEQDSKIQKVSDQLKLNKPALQVVANNH